MYTDGPRWGYRNGPGAPLQSTPRFPCRARDQCVCGSPSELMIVLGIVVIFLVANALSRARARTRPLQPEDDDGIRVRFLPDDDTKPPDEEK
jgi:hypothetical protein